MTEEEKAIEKLSMKAITSSAEAPDYPNCIVMKKDLIIILNLIERQEKEIESLKNTIEMKKDIIQDYKDQLTEELENRDRWD